MLLLLLLLPFLLDLLGARDVPRDTSYVIKKITTCPDVGYYFQRETIPNSLQQGACYLCFCQDDGTALCWKRENRRCDVTSYKHHKLDKRDARVRRSPLSISDIFFRDAARDISGKETTQECKPYESTFSEDCPPADWCIGCTVCDCDTHGNWNCHILSFCPDKNNKIKTTKKPLRKPRKPQMKNSAPKPTKTTIKNTKSTRSTKTTSRPNRPVKRQTNKVKDTVKQTHKASKYIKKNNKPSSKPLIIRKGKETKKPMVLKSTDNGYRLNDSDRELITKEVLKSVVTVMQKMLNNSQMINAQLLKVLPSPKSIQKRSNKRWRRNFTYTQKPPLPKPKNRRYKNKQLNVNRKGFTKEALKRSKRDVTVTEIYGDSQIYKTIRADKQILSNNGTFLNATKDDDYFKYFVVTENPYTDITEQHTFRIINAENYNNKDENSVAEAVKTEKEFSIVAENLGYKPNISLSIENEIIGERYIPTEPISYLNEIKIHNDNIFTAIEINKTKLHTTEMNSTKNINNISQIPKVNDNKITYNYYVTKTKNVENNKNVTPSTSSHLIKNYTSKFKNNLKSMTNKNFVHSKSSVISHTAKFFKSRLFNKINDIQSIFRKLLNDLRNKNNTKTTTPKPTRRKFNIMKYLKKIFRKVFRRRNSKSTVANNSSIIRSQLKNHVVEAICEIFDNCLITKKNRKSLESKINELYSESNNIFRSIKIIKGLLHLIEFPNGQINDTGKPYFKDDIHKLNYILKNQYQKSEQELTQNQVTQVNYIKNNTHIFIQSVGRFATLLNEIIAILTNNKDEQRDRRNIINPNGSKNLAVTKVLTKLKNILKKYNLVQNTFMRKIYETLNKFGTDQDKGAMSQVSYKNTKNVNRTTTEIEQFSRNIIENLRKLKNLAEMLNSRSRRKRNVMEDDDTIEYLLTLMEYMLKQTYPLDTAPVNDGIDLLIDAIKSAPDIKPIKKKVLQSSYKRISRTTEEIPHILSDDVSSDSSRNSKEDNITSVPSGTAEEVVGLTVGQYKDDQNGHKSIFDENTESVYYVRDFTTDSTTNLNQIVESTPYVTENNSKEVQKDSNQFDKFENDNGKKFEVYSADMDDDDSSAEITSTTAVPEKELEVKAMTTDVTIDTTELEKSIATPKINAKGKSRSSEGSDKPVSIDWLDDSYEQDIKENGTSSRTEATKIVSSSLKPILQKHGDVVSSMTKEYSDEHIKKEKAKWTAEKLMRQKQMDLLNSLDYGTERSEVEDADSKDDKDDTFSADYS